MTEEEKQAAQEQHGNKSIEYKINIERERKCTQGNRSKEKRWSLRWMRTITVECLRRSPRPNTFRRENEFVHPLALM
jgi:hypothetical protein